MEDEDSSDQQIDDLYNTKPTVHSETLRIACSQLLEMYIDEEYFKLGREIGKLPRWGELDALGILNPAPDEYQIVDTPGVDIFGNPLTKKYNFECESPKCHRTLAASRFAPHLEKCMGMGRNSSRIASRRLAASASSNSNNNNNSHNSSSDASKNAGQGNASGSQAQNPLNGELGSEDDHFEEDDDDEDWSLDRKKKTKKANEKVAVKRKGPLSRVKNTDGGGAKGKRGASRSVTDSPASLGAVDNSIQDEDDSTHMSLP